MSAEPENKSHARAWGISLAVAVMLLFTLEFLVGGFVCGLVIKAYGWPAGMPPSAVMQALNIFYAPARKLLDISPAYERFTRWQVELVLGKMP